MVSNTKIIFAKAPTTFPNADEHMAIQKSEIDLEDEIPQGAILLKTLCLSVDPYMRGLMRDPDAESYAPGFTLNEPMSGYVMASVAKSNNDKFKVDDYVYGISAFAEYTLVPESDTAYFEVRNDAKESSLPLTNYISVLGMPGMTAYVGLIKFGKPQKGESLYVSAASGAIGQLVGQIGKILGLYVVGSAGSDEKVKHLKSIGFDGAFNYKIRDTKEAFAELLPNGIDIYFENVGGKMLEDVIDHANDSARLVCCGMVSQYNTTEPFGVRNLFQVVPKALSLLGFVVGKSPEMQEPFRKDVAKWLQDGLIYRETVADGIEKTPQALVDVLHGNNIGKQVVKVV